jgi:hypothetical protein
MKRRSFLSSLGGGALLSGLALVPGFRWLGQPKPSAKPPANFLDPPTNSGMLMAGGYRVETVWSQGPDPVVIHLFLRTDWLGYSIPEVEFSYDKTAEAGRLSVYVNGEHQWCWTMEATGFAVIWPHLFGYSAEVVLEGAGAKRLSVTYSLESGQ